MPASEMLDLWALEQSVFGEKLMVQWFFVDGGWGKKLDVFLSI